LEGGRRKEVKRLTEVREGESGTWEGSVEGWKLVNSVLVLSVSTSCSFQPHLNLPPAVLAVVSLELNGKESHLVEVCRYYFRKSTPVDQAVSSRSLRRGDEGNGARVLGSRRLFRVVEMVLEARRRL
jgi:hypothetical protein